MCCISVGSGRRHGSWGSALGFGRDRCIYGAALDKARFGQPRLVQE